MFVCWVLSDDLIDTERSAEISIYRTIAMSFLPKDCISWFELFCDEQSFLIEQIRVNGDKDQQSYVLVAVLDKYLTKECTDLFINGSVVTHVVFKKQLRSICCFNRLLIVLCSHNSAMLGLIFTSRYNMLSYIDISASVQTFSK